MGVCRLYRCPITKGDDFESRRPGEDLKVFRRSIARSYENLAQRRGRDDDLGLCLFQGLKQIIYAGLSLTPFTLE